jgi:hypothetical protein
MSALAEGEEILPQNGGSGISTDNLHILGIVDHLVALQFQADKS